MAQYLSDNDILEGFKICLRESYKTTQSHITFVENPSFYAGSEQRRRFNISVEYDVSFGTSQIEQLSHKMYQMRDLFLSYAERDFNTTILMVEDIRMHKSVNHMTFMTNLHFVITCYPNYELLSSYM